MTPEQYKAIMSKLNRMERRIIAILRASKAGKTGLHERRKAKRKPQ